MLYVEVDESRLDSRDVGRISIVNSVVLVSISDDDREYIDCDKTLLDSHSTYGESQLLLFRCSDMQHYKCQYP